MKMKPFLSRLTLLAGFVAAPLLTGCATDRAVVQQAAQFHSGLEPAVIEDLELSSYIQRVGDRIIAGAREYNQQNPDTESKESRDWMFSDDVRFHFVNSKTLNAFTTGGEHMYIYTELFREADTEDELAAVMAHEFAHIYGRHVHSGMNRQYAILGATAAAGAGGYALGGSEKGAEYAGLGAGLAQLAGQYVGMSYTRADEVEADALGFEFYVRAGYDPERFKDFFQTMIDKGLDKGNEQLSSHPSLKSRVEAAERRAADLSADARRLRRPPVAQGREYERLQERTVEVARNMPDDQSLAKTQLMLAAMNRSCLTPVIQEDQQKAEVAVMKRVEDVDEKGANRDRPKRRRRQ